MFGISCTGAEETGFGSARQEWNWKADRRISESAAIAQSRLITDYFPQMGAETLESNIPNVTLIT
ncbi:MAG TPA: hypothetical protein VK530_02465 [Candidatus Acidoferrum sp.]|nr:hypothetical protein [Candidatus Acidoferrum sp.]